MKTHIFTPFACGTMTELFSKDRANACFENQEVVFFAGGTGHPYFSTDTGITLRAVEMDADVYKRQAYGAKLQLNTKVENLDSLKDSYDYVLLAAGASEPGVLKLEKGEPVNALEFLADFKKHDGNLDLGKNVVVIGGGNTAMDTARAAKRTKGVEHVYLVYRRTKRYMPADEDVYKRQVLLLNSSNN